ncbi:MAG: hypothetical protein JXA66_00580 [Oligoflexia bacterium]|nr:hypothetical protein [Oligoflexia bacterium]
MTINNVTELKAKAFHELQPYRIQEILLVSSPYDAFIFEEDGQLTERIFNDYVDLNLHYAPRVTNVSSSSLALEMLVQKKFDLVITTLQLEGMGVVKFCKEVKKDHPRMPVVLLTHVPANLSLEQLEKWQANFCAIFAWNGDTKIFLAIIKLIEDALNVAHDTELASVRVILVIEDSIRSYSSFLPLLYSEIMNQTKALISESINKSSKIFRMRARPKVLLAGNYEEAMSICDKYKHYIIGVISDVRFPRNGVLCDEAGFEIIKYAKNMVYDVPTILYSSSPKNREKAFKLGGAFLDKNSPTLLQELEILLKEKMGFGKFVFRKENGKIVGEASDMIELEEGMKKVPDESIFYHAKRDHFSRWFMARGEFMLAGELRSVRAEDYEVKQLREILTGLIANYRLNSRQGVITEFSKKRFDPNQPFNKLGTGSLGGKARGLAFVSSLLAKSYTGKFIKKFPGVEVSIPPTTVISTDEFDRFMNENEFSVKELEKENDGKIAEKFLNAQLSDEITEDLFALLKRLNSPIAVRSSSLLEDSHSQPFAGIYSTFMLPNNDPKIEIRLEQLMNAIKAIYASTFFESSRSYLYSTGNRIEEEKMGIIIQQVAGVQYGDLFYPDFSGTLRSVNFFPVSHMKPEDGIAYVGLGLGKIIADGFSVLQFSPKHPGILPQFLTIESALENTQKYFYAINLSNSDVKITADQESTLSKCTLERAEKDGILDALASVYDYENEIIRDGLHHNGARIVSFAHILKSNIFPLAELLVAIREMGEEGLGSDVEIEFAVELSKNRDKLSKFNFLQIRPMISSRESDDICIDGIEESRVICRSSLSLGNGAFRDIKDIVYVKPDVFDASRTVQIAQEIGAINEHLGDKAVFIGMGRWGTSDHWLGIPVKWNEISKAAVLVEASLEDFNIEPSHGSHFFHNITSLGMGYLAVLYNSAETSIDWDWLNQQKTVNNTRFVSHIRLDKPLEILIHGRKRKGYILKPV